MVNVSASWTGALRAVICTRASLKVSPRAVAGAATPRTNQTEASARNTTSTSDRHRCRPRNGGKRERGDGTDETEAREARRCEAARRLPAGRQTPPASCALNSSTRRAAHQARSRCFRARSARRAARRFRTATGGRSSRIRPEPDEQPLPPSQFALTRRLFPAGAAFHIAVTLAGLRARSSGDRAFASGAKGARSNRAGRSPESRRDRRLLRSHGGHQAVPHHPRPIRTPGFRWGSRSRRRVGRLRSQRCSALV